MISRLLLPASRRLGGLAFALCGLSAVATAQTRILFVGNSFTHGKYAPVLNYNSAAITDENYGLPSTNPRYQSVASEPGPWGGIPGIFKKMTDEAGLNYEVHIEAISGNSLQYHYNNALSVIAQPTWNKVVLQEVSTRPIPTARGGSRAVFYDYSTRLEQAIHAANPAAQVYLYQTWARADLTYPASQPYAGLPIDTMTADLHRGYYQAFFSNGRYAAVAPVGDAWLRAIAAGTATRDPYNADPTKLNLWAVDYNHPSKWGCYLSACVLFAQITGVDPRTLGAAELAAAALGITPAAAVALQQLAYQQVNVVVTAAAAPRAGAATLTVWPNPATSYVLITGLATGSAVQLIDALGRVACATTVSAVGEVSVSGLAPGFYILRATDAQGRPVTGRVVVE
jgi:hypothetical protein